jgi:hypothetical protein
MRIKASSFPVPLTRLSIHWREAERRPPLWAQKHSQCICATLVEALRLSVIAGERPRISEWGRKCHWTNEPINTTPRLARNKKNPTRMTILLVKRPLGDNGAVTVPQAKRSNSESAAEFGRVGDKREGDVSNGRLEDGSHADWTSPASAARQLSLQPSRKPQAGKP